MKEEFKPFLPFDKVLVKDDMKDGSVWTCGHFSHIANGYYICGGRSYKYCIPYNGNEHLVGTADAPIKPKLQVIRGDRKRCTEVIKMLEELGGSRDILLNGPITGAYSNYYYYINEYSIIEAKPTVSTFFCNFELEILKLPEPKLKVIKGNKTRGKDVIEYLIKNGGRNVDDLEGAAENIYYFINEDGNIESRLDYDIYLNDYELEVIELPKQKLTVIRGVEDKGECVIKMLEDFGGVDRGDFDGTYKEWFYYINNKGFIDAKNSSDEFFNDYELELIKFSEEPKRWRGEKDDTFYYITIYGEVFRSIEMKSSAHNDLYKAGNYFRTREEAEVMLNKIKALFKR